MLIFNKKQIKDWDKRTIHLENITSWELMEEASNVFVKWFMSLYFDKSADILVLAGIGNNGGDALAVARILHSYGYQVNILHIISDNKLSQDCLINLNMIKVSGLTYEQITELTEFKIDKSAIVIDGILGSGLSRPVAGWLAQQINYINELPNTIVSVDIPSGLDADQGVIGHCIKANRTLSFETPKLAFFFKESAFYLGEWDFRSIGLNPIFLKESRSSYHMITREMIKTLFKERTKFQSKSDFGFGQLCGGSEGMLGAVLLCTNAAIKSGIGRIVVTTPKIHHQSVFVSCPIAMVQSFENENKNELIRFKVANQNISALACGPGLGSNKMTHEFLESLLSYEHIPLILDADALNIISKNNWQTRIPKHSILTPHHEEFQRIAGYASSHKELIEKQIQFSVDHDVYIALKGAHTSISTPGGEIYFNNTGNVGLATAGSGDVLTGILLSFLAQGYSQLDSCLISVFIHGLAGDLGSEKYGQISMDALNIIECLPQVLKAINGK